MLTIERLLPADLPDLVGFIQALQEYERAANPDLLPGAAISVGYAENLLSNIASRNGVIFLARIGEQAVGFASAWIDEDDDPLLRREARSHAYVSDIYVGEEWRRSGVGLRLLGSIETEMRQRGCRRIRICSKATSLAALKCYEAAGYTPYEIIFSKPIDLASR